MPAIVSGSRVNEAVEKSTFIIGGVPKTAEAVKYDFHMGSKVLKAEFGQPVELDAIPLDKRWIAPGEVAFVLTKERVCLPRNMIALLSPKRKLAHAGVMVLGGLAVDPEYKGVLVVGLYNFSSTPFALRPDQRIIAASFYELSDAELGEFPVGPPHEITDFPDELVDLIKHYKPFEVRALSDALAETQKRLDTLTQEVHEDKSWKREFQENLERQSREIDKLLEGLRDEKTVRKEEDKAIRDKLDTMSSLFFGGRYTIAGLIFLAGVIVTVIVTWMFGRMMDPRPAPTPAPIQTVAPTPAPSPAKKP